MASRGPERAPSRWEGVTTAADFLDHIREDYNANASGFDWYRWLIDSRSAGKEVETSSNLMFGDEGPLRERLGRFRIVRHLGSGGFADVYLARDPELERDVAIKVLKSSHLTSAEARCRLEREARALARISHPNVVPVFEFGTASGVSYLASEYCGARSLEDRVSTANEALSQQESVAIVAVVAEALEHCHRQGICHRDIKPSNILLQELTQFPTDPLDRAYESVKIIDFGLAKYTVDDQFLTLDGTRVGTPAYMSPEQARGETGVTPLSDVYSLGAVLFHLLVGQPPNLRSSYGATLQAIQAEPLSRAELRNAGVPRDLQAICGKALEKGEAYRYASAGALARDLRAWLCGMPVSARPVGNWGHLVRWTRRHPMLAASLASLFAILLSGILFTNHKWAEATRQSSRADRQVRNLLSTSDFVLAEYANQLEANKDLDASQRAILEHMVEVHQAMLGERGNLEETTAKGIETMLRLAKILRLVGETPQATRYIDLGLAELSAMESARDLDALGIRLRHEFLLQRFLIDYDRGEYQSALLVLDQIDQRLNTSGGRVDVAWQITEWQHSRRHRALCQRQTGELAMASATLRAAIEELNQDLLPSHPELAYPLLLMTLTELAALDLQAGLDDAAVDSLRTIVSTATELLKTQPENSSLIGTIAQCQSELAALLKGSGSADAPAMIESAVERFAMLHGMGQLHDYGGYVLALRRKARIQQQVGDFEAALSACQQGLEMNDLAGDSANRSMEQMLLLHLHGRLVFEQNEDVVALDDALNRAADAGRTALRRWPNSPEIKTGLAEVLYALGRLRSEVDWEAGNAFLKEALHTLRGVTEPDAVGQRDWRLATQIAKRYFLQHVERDQVGDGLAIWDSYCDLAPDDHRLPQIASAGLQRLLRKGRLSDQPANVQAIENSIKRLNDLAAERKAVREQ